MATWSGEVIQRARCAELASARPSCAYSELQTAGMSGFSPFCPHGAGAVAPRFAYA